MAAGVRMEGHVAGGDTIFGAAAGGAHGASGGCQLGMLGIAGAAADGLHGSGGSGTGIGGEATAGPSTGDMEEDTLRGSPARSLASVAGGAPARSARACLAEHPLTSSESHDGVASLGGCEIEARPRALGAARGASVAIAHVSPRALVPIRSRSADAGVEVRAHRPAQRTHAFAQRRP